MAGLVSAWADINSGTGNLAGLAALSAEVKTQLAVLKGDMDDVAVEPFRSIDAQGRVVQTPIAPAISICKHPNAPLRVFLGIHLDTVYAADDPFQRVERIEPNVLRGPGVADAKGGLAVMLIALEALERSPLAGRIGWEVLLNADEEIGSPGSAKLLADCARRNHLGMVFEPALPDGALVGARKGSGNYTAVIRGRSAHAGRDFHAGRNAIHAAAAMTLALHALNGAIAGVTVNVGKIDGGGPVNVVPDLAICRFNVRVPGAAEQAQVQKAIERVAAEIDLMDGISVELTGGVTSPPKPLDGRVTTLFQHVIACGEQLGLALATGTAGGVCDGNKLAAAGLPVVDSLGPRGGNLHSPREYLLLHSLTERAKLSALLLLKLAAGELRWDDDARPPTNP